MCKHKSGFVKFKYLHFLKFNIKEISTKNCVKEIIEKLREVCGQNAIKSISFYLRKLKGKHFNNILYPQRMLKFTHFYFSQSFFMHNTYTRSAYIFMLIKAFYINLKSKFLVEGVFP